MGEIYTCTNNAISITDKTLGETGLEGWTGINGRTGNPWATGILDPNEIYVSIPNFVTDSNGIITISGYTNTPGPYQGVTSFNPEVTTPFPATGNVLQTGDTYIHRVTGEWWVFNSSNVFGSQWVKQLTLFRGVTGPPNYKVTEVSFNHGGDGKTLHKDTGWTVNIPYARQLIGHVIYPGSAVAGTINSAKIAVTTKTETNAVDVQLHVVNLGISTAGIDDIIVANKTFASSGDGSLDSMRIVDMNVNAANIPTTPQVFGVFVLLKKTVIQEKLALDQIKSAYTNEIAVNYKQEILKAQEETRDSFYKVLTRHGINSTNETTEDRNKRISEERNEKAKRDSKAKADEDAFSEDPSSATGSKAYPSFRKGGGRNNKRGDGTIPSPPTPPGTDADFLAEVTIHHLSLR